MYYNAQVLQSSKTNTILHIIIITVLAGANAVVSYNVSYASITVILLGGLW